MGYREVGLAWSGPLAAVSFQASRREYIVRFLSLLGIHFCKASCLFFHISLFVLPEAGFHSFHCGFASKRSPGALIMRYEWKRGRVEAIKILNHKKRTFVLVLSHQNISHSEALIESRCISIFLRLF